jgi:hypothetical protein
LLEDELLIEEDELLTEDELLLEEELVLDEDDEDDECNPTSKSNTRLVFRDCIPYLSMFHLPITSCSDNAYHHLF